MLTHPTLQGTKHKYAPGRDIKISFGCIFYKNETQTDKANTVYNTRHTERHYINEWYMASPKGVHLNTIIVI